MDTTNTPLPAMLDATAPTLSATTFLERRTKPLINWRNDFLEWNRTHYEPRDKKEIKAEVYRFCDTALTPSGTAFKPTIKKVDEIMAAIQVKTLVPDRFKPYGDIRSGEPMPGFTISCQNGLLDLCAGTLSAHSDQWLILNSLPFPYDPSLPEPIHWVQFLKSLWPDDDHQEGGAIATLQEMLGYLVSGRTDMQKIFLLIGPPRSGKGTIAYVIENLIGAQNYVGVQFAQLTEPTGMQVLIGKTVMMIPDARSAYAPNLGAVTERLLNISGEDVMSVRRKYLGDWTGALSTRVVISTNEIPRLHDMSGAIATRFVPIRMMESFLGREDVDLKKKLQPELPQILKWAVDGARRLYDRGRFVIPVTATEVLDEVAEAAAPHLGFIRERLVRDPDAELTKQQLYSEFRKWCAENGHQACAENIFAQRIRMAVPDLKECHPRGQPRCWRGIWVRREGDNSPSPLDPEPTPTFNPDPRAAAIFV